MHIDWDAVLFVGAMVAGIAFLIVVGLVAH